MTETRHYHGDSWHDHPGGDVPHDHAGPARDWRGAAWGVLNGVSAAVSGVLALLAGLAWAWTDHSAQECRSAIVGALAPDQCTTVTFWHDVAGIAALTPLSTPQAAPRQSRAGPAWSCGTSPPGWSCQESPW